MGTRSLESITVGTSNQEIAEALSISFQTVKSLLRGYGQTPHHPA
ncbi:MAG: hypothetical protein HOP27_00360 [Anaerolineales bacterium]|nr:hypothetical protein [Anaerolineales bacterium]